MTVQKINFGAGLTLLISCGLVLPAQAQVTAAKSTPPTPVITNGVVVQGGSAYLGNTEVKPTVNSAPELSPQPRLDAVKIQPEESEVDVFGRMVSGIKLDRGISSQTPTAQFPETRPVGVGIVNLEL